MAIGGVVLNFAARTADAVRDVNDLARAIRNAGDDADRADGRMSSLKGSLKAGLAAGAAAAGAALVTAGAALVTFGKSALEDAASAQKLADVLSTIPGVTQSAIDANAEWIDGMQIATTIADTDLRDAIAKLTLATGSLTTAQDLTALSADVAAGSGRNFAKVSEAMAKAAGGNTSQLERMFPWLDKNKDGTVTLAEATTGLGTAYKGAAEKAADRKPWERVKVIWDEIKESLGTSVIPAVEKFGDWFKDKKNQKALQDFIGDIGDAAREMGEELVPAIEKFLKWMGSEDARKDMSAFAKDMRDIAGATADLVGWLASAYNWAQKVYAWLKKFDDVTTGAIWGKLGFPGGGGRSAPAPAVSRLSTPTGAGAPVYTSPATVVVTEDQVYRAVSRLILAGDARNGRSSLVIP